MAKRALERPLQNRDCTGDPHQTLSLTAENMTVQAGSDCSLLSELNTTVLCEYPRKHLMPKEHHSKTNLHKANDFSESRNDLSPVDSSGSESIYTTIPRKYYTLNDAAIQRLRENDYLASKKKTSGAKDRHEKDFGSIGPTSPVQVMEATMASPNGAGRYPLWHYYSEERTKSVLKSLTPPSKKSVETDADSESPSELGSLTFLRSLQKGISCHMREMKKKPLTSSPSASPLYNPKAALVQQPEHMTTNYPSHASDTATVDSPEIEQRRNSLPTWAHHHVNVNLLHSTPANLKSRSIAAVATVPATLELLSSSETMTSDLHPRIWKDADADADDSNASASIPPKPVKAAVIVLAAGEIVPRVLQTSCGPIERNASSMQAISSEQGFNKQQNLNDAPNAVLSEQEREREEERARLNGLIAAEEAHLARIQELTGGVVSETMEKVAKIKDLAVAAMLGETLFNAAQDDAEGTQVDAVDFPPFNSPSPQCSTQHKDDPSPSLPCEVNAPIPMDGGAEAPWEDALSHRFADKSIGAVPETIEQEVATHDAVTVDQAMMTSPVPALAILDASTDPLFLQLEDKATAISPHSSGNGSGKKENNCEESAGLDNDPSSTSLEEPREKEPLAFEGGIDNDSSQTSPIPSQDTSELRPDEKKVVADMIIEMNATETATQTDIKTFSLISFSTEISVEEDLDKPDETLEEAKDCPESIPNHQNSGLDRSNSNSNDSKCPKHGHATVREIPGDDNAMNHDGTTVAVVRDTIIDPDSPLGPEKLGEELGETTLMNEEDQENHHHSMEISVHIGRIPPTSLLPVDHINEPENEPKNDQAEVKFIAEADDDSPSTSGGQGGDLQGVQDREDATTPAAAEATGNPEANPAEAVMNSEDDSQEEKEEEEEHAEQPEDVSSESSDGDSVHGESSVPAMDIFSLMGHAFMEVLEDTVLVSHVLSLTISTVLNAEESSSLFDSVSDTATTSSGTLQSSTNGTVSNVSIPPLSMQSDVEFHRVNVDMPQLALGGLQSAQEALDAASAAEEEEEEEEEKAKQEEEIVIATRVMTAAVLGDIQGEKQAACENGEEEILTPTPTKRTKWKHGRSELCISLDSLTGDGPSTSSGSTKVDHDTEDSMPQVVSSSSCDSPMVPPDSSVGSETRGHISSVDSAGSAGAVRLDVVKVVIRRPSTTPAEVDDSQEPHPAGKTRSRCMKLDGSMLSPHSPRSPHSPHSPRSPRNSPRSWGIGIPSQDVTPPKKDSPRIPQELSETAVFRSDFAAAHLLTLSEQADSFRSLQSSLRSYTIDSNSGSTLGDSLYEYEPPEKEVPLTKIAMRNLSGQGRSSVNIFRNDHDSSFHSRASTEAGSGSGVRGDVESFANSAMAYSPCGTLVYSEGAFGAMLPPPSPKRVSSTHTLSTHETGISSQDIEGASAGVCSVVGSALYSEQGSSNRRSSNSSNPTGNRSGSTIPEKDVPEGGEEEGHPVPPRHRITEGALRKLQTISETSSIHMREDHNDFEASQNFHFEKTSANDAMSFDETQPVRTSTPVTSMHTTDAPRNDSKSHPTNETDVLERCLEVERIISSKMSSLETQMGTIMQFLTEQASAVARIEATAAAARSETVTQAATVHPSTGPDAAVQSNANADANANANANADADANADETETGTTIERISLQESNQLEKGDCTISTVSICEVESKSKERNKMQEQQQQQDQQSGHCKPQTALNSHDSTVGSTMEAAALLQRLDNYETELASLRAFVQAAVDPEMPDKMHSVEGQVASLQNSLLTLQVSPSQSLPDPMDIDKEEDEEKEPVVVLDEDAPKMKAGSSVASRGSLRPGILPKVSLQLSDHYLAISSDDAPEQDQSGEVPPSFSMSLSSHAGVSSAHGKEAYESEATVYPPYPAIAHDGHSSLSNSQYFAAIAAMEPPGMSSSNAAYPIYPASPSLPTYSPGHRHTSSPLSPALSQIYLQQRASHFSFHSPSTAPLATTAAERHHPHPHRIALDDLQPRIRPAPRSLNPLASIPSVLDGRSYVVDVIEEAEEQQPLSLSQSLSQSLTDWPVTYSVVGGSSGTAERAIARRLVGRPAMGSGPLRYTGPLAYPPYP
jgi:hypothetical protein